MASDAGEKQKTESRVDPGTAFALTNHLQRRSVSKTQVMFLEGGVGWVHYWLDRFDEKYLKSLPLDDRMLRRWIIYASDYSHWDLDWPNTVRHIVERNDLSQESQEKILTFDARSFYGEL
jgi:hypothetical protein